MRPNLPVRVFLLTGVVAFAFSPAGLADIVDTRTASIGAGDIAEVSIKAGAGRLEINGSPEATQISVTAEFDVDAPMDRVQQVLDTLTFRTEVQGATLLIEARTEGDHHGDDKGRIHPTVTVPDRMKLDVSDGSGPMSVRNVGGDLTIRDGSADIDVADAGGNVTVRDGSGDITLTRVDGWADIKDGSGSIQLQEIGMAVTVTDSSGDIDIRRVGGDVVVSDSSGGIDVREIDGNFEVLRDSSGRIRYEKIQGSVKVPKG